MVQLDQCISRAKHPHTNPNAVEVWKKCFIHGERNAYMYDKRLHPGRPKKRPLDKPAKHVRSLLSTATTCVIMNLQPGALEQG